MASHGARRGYFSIAAQPGPIPELDGLRGVAILLVLLRHAARPVVDQHGGIFSIGAWDVSVAFLNGWMGVDLFFVLSGFLITHHLLQRWPRRFHLGFLARYWLKRVLRTFPAYYAVLFLVAAGLLPFYRPDVDDMTGQVLLHLLFLQDYLGSALVPAFWSLAVEEKFYLICPFALLWLRRCPRSRQFVLLAALAVLPMLMRAATFASQAGTLHTYEDFFWTIRSPFHLAVDGLWMGVTTALIYRWYRPELSQNAGFRRTLACLGSIVVATLLLARAWFDDRHFVASIAVLWLVPLAFSAVVLAVTLGPTAISRFLRARWLRFLAAISYSVYLIHLLVVPPALALTELVLRAHGASPGLMFVVFLPIFVALSVCAGLALHLSVEKPFLLLKDRVRL